MLNSVGAQQRRQRAGKIVQIVYGIATDGISFEFLRLDGSQALRVSAQYRSDTKERRDEMYVHYMKYLPHLILLFLLDTHNRVSC